MRAVLTYHSIDDSGSPISVSPREFETHMDFLAASEVEVLPLRELVNDTSRGGDAVAITFDDGFQNFEASALPQLVEHKLPATLFVVTGRVGSSNAWGGQDHPGIPTMALLDWDGLARVRDAGIDLGAHTRTHPHLTRLDPTDRTDELTAPIETLQSRLGVRADTLAYPYGDHDQGLARLAGAHYAVACTTQLGVVEPDVDPLRVPRLDMFYFRSPGRLESFGTQRFRAYLGFRRGLRSIRKVVAGP